MEVSIIGATGSCGREIVGQLIRDRVLESNEVLQLVGSNPESRHPWLLHGMRADLQDAYAEIIPQIDVTSDENDIIGDVIVVTGGATLSTDIRDLQQGVASRDTLARVNAQVFHRFAKAIAESCGDSPPVVIIVSNPVELGVKIFSEYLPRENVIGMGAYSDSLRFRLEIARELGVRRQRVHAYMCGEHGNAMVPLWNSVRVQGFSADELRAAIRRLRRGAETRQFPELLQRHQKELMQILASDPVNGAGRALGLVQTLTADLQVVLKPFAIHYAHAKTHVATAAATSSLVKAVCEGRSIEIAAQVMHEGENGRQGPFGGRLILAGKVRRILDDDDCSEQERELMQNCAAVINAKIKEWSSGN